ncbi:MAG: AraC family transcriptional regulator [Prevotella sp.]|nr:AraC family transcriptional regulator [Prevotella sp.]
MTHLIVSFLPLAVCAFWSVAIATHLWEQGNRAALRQLLLWTVTATLLYGGHFVFFNRMTSLIPVSDTVYVVCNLLVYPLYLYYLTMLTMGTVSNRQRWLTMLPPIIIGIVVAIIYTMMSGDECHQFVDTYLYKNSLQGLSGLAMAQAVVHHLAKGLFAIGVLTVLFLGIRRIHRYNRLIDSIYADNDDKRLYGITTILILMVLTGILSFAVNAVGRFVFLSSEIPFAVLACFFSCLLYMLCYRGFVQQFSFADIAREECEDTMEVAPQEGYSHLLQKIDDEKLYLQPGLTLAELAQMLGTNRTMLSKMVNEETGMPFAEFINRKRIAYIKRLEKEHPELRKEELAKHAGYTSMRSFYRNYHLYSDTSGHMFDASIAE